MRTIVMVAVGTALLSCVGAGSASALSSKECSVKYQAAKQAGTLGAQKWANYRKAECGTGASAAAASAAPMAPAATATPAPAAPAPSVARTAPAPASTVGSSAADASYPSAVDPKYAKEGAGKARMHTCLDGYKAAKASGTLGSAKWIEKGGGYYSACNAHLKGV